MSEARVSSNSNASTAYNGDATVSAEDGHQAGAAAQTGNEAQASQTHASALTVDCHRAGSSLASHAHNSQALGGDLGNECQLLRIEMMQDRDARVAIVALKLSVLFGLLGITTLCILRESAHGEEYFVFNKAYHATWAALSGLLLLLFGGYTLVWANSIRASVRDMHRHWTLSRRRLVENIAARAAVLIVILLDCLIVNAMVLADVTLLCRRRALFAWFGFVRWNGWNTMLLLHLIDAHSVLVRRPKKEEENTTHAAGMEGTVRELPWSRHWKKLGLWVVNCGLLLWIAIEEVQDDALKFELPGSCTWGARPTCHRTLDSTIAAALLCAGFCAYGILYILYLARGRQQLRQELYQKYRVANLLLQLQVRVNIITFCAFITGVAVLWFLSRDKCSNFIVSWFGILPLVFANVAIHAATFFITMPSLPHDSIPAVLLQQFAWSEASKPRDMRVRTERLTQLKAPKRLRTGPMFCLETAIKAFYWACLVYDYTEEDGLHGEDACLPDLIRDSLGGIEDAMELFDLGEKAVFYDDEQNTKVMVSWSESLILVAVRGTMVAANMVADLKMGQVAHPPKRKHKGRTPRVHIGFLQTWQSDGINERVIGFVSRLLDSADDRAAVRIICTGHSLGGSVASLAAMDMVLRLGVKKERLEVYTYGCPRVGNHAFAREYGKRVPDTWHIINDQDIVTSGMKLMGLYKRAGARVFVTNRGDLIVRPTFLELSLLQSTITGSVKQHFFESYQDAFVMVLHKRLDEPDIPDVGPLDGITSVVQDVPVVREVLRAKSETQGALQWLSNMVPARDSESRTYAPASPRMSQGRRGSADGRSRTSSSALEAQRLSPGGHGRLHSGMAQLSNDVALCIGGSGDTDNGRAHLMDGGRAHMSNGLHSKESNMLEPTEAHSSTGTGHGGHRSTAASSAQHASLPSSSNHNMASTGHERFPAARPSTDTKPCVTNQLRHQATPFSVAGASRADNGIGAAVPDVQMALRPSMRPVPEPMMRGTKARRRAPGASALGSELHAGSAALARMRGTTDYAPGLAAWLKKGSDRLASSQVNRLTSSQVNRLTSSQVNTVHHGSR